MKILVTVKRVEDYESKIKVKPDGSWIQTDGVNYKANPFDDIALEEALRLKPDFVEAQQQLRQLSPAANPAPK